MSSGQRKIVASAIRKVFPTVDSPVIAIDEFSLEVDDGEFVAIVGPSGCGKTTFLRILAGLDEATSGTVHINRSQGVERPLNAVVFQEYGIFPWKTVNQNVGFGLEMRHVPRVEREEIVARWVGRVGLTGFEGSYPHQLSGGMKQRVSIARALAHDAEVLLMDEPLAALDAQTRTSMQEELLHLWSSLEKTVVYITHSIDEALFLSDRVVVMSPSPGRKEAEYEVPLERPRELAMLKEPQVSELSLQIWKDLKPKALSTSVER